MPTATGLDVLLARHDDFWRRGETDRPLVGTSRWPGHSMSDFDWGLPADEGVLLPDMLHAEHLVPQFEAYYRDGGALDGDLIWPATPLRGVFWLEAIAGATLRYSVQQGWMSTHPTLEAFALSDPVCLDDNAWFQKLVELIAALAQGSGGRFAVSLPLTHGPWEMVSALIGMQRLYVELHDRPLVVQALADQCASIWIDVTHRLSRAVPSWQGGHVSYFGLWRQRFPVVAQNDMATSVSPSMYSEYVLAADRRTLHAWDSSWFHLHSKGVHLLDSILSALGERAINVVIDPSGPGLQDLLPALRRVQEHNTPLHVLCNTEAQVERLTDSLSPKGLAITRQPT
jgi:hypothetical protein